MTPRARISDYWNQLTALSGTAHARYSIVGVLLSMRDRDGDAGPLYLVYDTKSVV